MIADAIQKAKKICYQKNYSALRSMYSEYGYCRDKVVYEEISSRLDIVIKRWNEEDPDFKATLYNQKLKDQLCYYLPETSGELKLIPNYIYSQSFQRIEEKIYLEISHFIKMNSIKKQDINVIELSNVLPKMSVHDSIGELTVKCKALNPHFSQEKYFQKSQLEVVEEYIPQQPSDNDQNEGGIAPNFYVEDNFDNDIPEPELDIDDFEQFNMGMQNIYEDFIVKTSKKGNADQSTGAMEVENGLPQHTTPNNITEFKTVGYSQQEDQILSEAQKLVNQDEMDSESEYEKVNKVAVQNGISDSKLDKSNTLNEFDEEEFDKMLEREIKSKSFKMSKSDDEFDLMEKSLKKFAPN